MVKHDDVDIVYSTDKPGDTPPLEGLHEDILKQAGYGSAHKRKVVAAYAGVEFTGGKRGRQAGTHNRNSKAVSLLKGVIMSKCEMIDGIAHMDAESVAICVGCKSEVKSNRFHTIYTCTECGLKHFTTKNPWHRDNRDEHIAKMNAGREQHIKEQQEAQEREAKAKQRRMARAERKLDKMQQPPEILQWIRAAESLHGKGNARLVGELDGVNVVATRVSTRTPWTYWEIAKK